MKAIPSVAVACLGLMGTLFACSGDDTVVTGGPDASVEAGDAADGAASRDTGRDVTATDVATSETGTDANPGDSSSVDSTATDSASETDSATKDGPVVDEGRPDTGGDATADAGDGEAVGDGAAIGDGSDGATAGPLALCGVLDTAWNISTDAGDCATATLSSCPDRANNWDSDIVVAFASLGDCRLNNLFAAIQDQTAYENQLLAWGEAFFGCPDPSTYDSGVIGFALVPAELSSHPFSQADLNALAQDWVLAAEQGIGADGDAPNPGAFSDTQLAEIQARLTQLETTVSGTTPSTTVYSYGSSCPDAGGDAQSD